MAREESLLIAARRGVVHSHVHRRGNVCDLSIISPGLVAFVCAMRLVKLSSRIDDILHDFAAAIARLRIIVSAAAVSRELWLRTPRGVWRFFRVLDDGILELDREGMPLGNGPGAPSNTIPFCAAQDGAVGLPVPHAGNPGAANTPQSGQKASAPAPDHGLVRKHIEQQNIGAAASEQPATHPPGEDPGVGTAGTISPHQPLLKNDAPEISVPPEINIELVRRFMRWREEKRRWNTRPG